jgi:signal transduction histidine kinase
MITRLILLTLAVLATLFVTLLVDLSKTVKAATKLAFSFLCFGLCLWQINILIADNINTNLELINNLVFIWPSVAVLGMGYFIAFLERKNESYKEFISIHRRYIYAIIILFGLQLGAIASGQIFTRVEKGIDGQLEFFRGSAYLIYIGALLTMLIIEIAKLVRSYRVHKKDPSQIKAIRAVFLTLIFTTLFSVIVNVVIPIVTSSQRLISLSVFSIVIFSMGLAYGIARYSFLNIKPVIARAASYFLSVSFLIILYASLAAGLVRNLIDRESAYGTPLLIVSLIAITLIYGPLKRFFDKITNRVFYRDAYEPQVLLDKLNKVLVSNIVLEQLLDKSSEVIGGTLKAEFCAFEINEVGGKPNRIIGATHKVFKDIDVGDFAHNVSSKIVLLDELMESNSEVQAILRHNNIAVLVKLTDQPNKQLGELGYIILGAKKSGNPYSSQDTKMLEIIADELVIAIQNALRFEEIQNFAATLQEKVDDATRQLRRTNEKLKQLDQTKDDFISMASHQLRTPLTSVKGYVSMVMEGDAGKINTQQRKLLDQAFISSQRMVYLIADLLNVSRLRTGKFIIEAKPTNLAEVVEGEITQLTETAKGRDLELTYKKPKEFPTLMLDDTKIRQVIMNFADNAIYYTPAGGHIQVALEDKGESIEFTVTDDGIGVPKSEQHHLFGKFYRAGNAKKARPDGTGLGLFMAKKVIIAQGGAIIFHTQEGKGSTFGFSFAKSPLLPEHFKGSVHQETTVSKQ